MINIENKSALLTVLGNGLKRCTRGSCRFQLLRSTIFLSLSQSNVKWRQGDFLLSGVWPRVNRLSMNGRRREAFDKDKYFDPRVHIYDRHVLVGHKVVNTTSTYYEMILALTVIQLGLHCHVTFWCCVLSVFDHYPSKSHFILFGTMVTYFYSFTDK